MLNETNAKSKAEKKLLFEIFFKDLTEKLEANNKTTQKQEKSKNQNKTNTDHIKQRLRERYIEELYVNDPATFAHSIKTANAAFKLAYLQDLPKSECELAFDAGLFHDMGKGKTSKNVLYKPDKLSADEFWEILQHPQRGIEAFNEFLAINTTAEERIALENESWTKQMTDAISQHHLSYDGKSGYPEINTIQPTEITQIVSTCDKLDAIAGSERKCIYQKNPNKLKPEYIQSEMHKEFKKGTLNPKHEISANIILKYQYSNIEIINENITTEDTLTAISDIKKTGFIDSNIFKKRIATYNKISDNGPNNNKATWIEYSGKYALPSIEQSLQTKTDGKSSLYDRIKYISNETAEKNEIRNEHSFYSVIDGTEMLTVGSEKIPIPQISDKVIKADKSTVKKVIKVKINNNKNNNKPWTETNPQLVEKYSKKFSTSTTIKSTNNDLNIQ